MACHLLCPNCQNKIFKISNMLGGDLETSEHVPPIFRQSSTTDNRDLVQENKYLKNELAELTEKNDHLLTVLEECKEKFENEFGKLKSRIASNEKQLNDKTKHYMDEQLKFVEEVKQLQFKNQKLHNQKETLEASLTGLESRLKILELDNNKLRIANNENADRCTKYKAKLKYAVQIVNDLNGIVAQYTNNKAKHVCETTQTECEHSGIPCKYHKDDSKYKRELNSEKLLLSDVFFKKKSFADETHELF